MPPNLIPTIISILIAIILIFLIKKWKKGGVCKNKHDMSGKFIIITGASSGLGKETALDLINNNARVIFACRTESKAKNAMKTIPNNLKKNAEFLKIDLCSFKSIKEFADKIKNNYPKIDILMNNAGAHPTKFILTEDNLDSFIQGNFIAHIYLTTLLLPHFKQKSRIINLSSFGHAFAKIKKGDILNFSNNDYIEKTFYKGLTSTFELYADTKLFMMYFTQYLSLLFEEEKYNYIKSVCLHPGLVNSEFFEKLSENSTNAKFLFSVSDWAMSLFAKTTIEGCQTQLYLSYADWEELVSGDYYADCERINTFELGRSKEIRNDVMEWSVNLIKKFFPEDDCVKELIDINELEKKYEVF